MLTCTVMLGNWYYETNNNSTAKLTLWQHNNTNNTVSKYLAKKLSFNSTN